MTEPTTPEPSTPNRWAKYANRALILFVAAAVIVVYFSASAAIKSERERAIRGECIAVNKAVAKIRVAVINVAGFQSKPNPSASADLREQIRTSNLLRGAFARQQAAAIPTLRCPGSSHRIRQGSPTTVIVHQP